MKIKLQGSIEFDDPAFIGNTFIAGDEVEIVWIYQRCPDLGCCPVDVYVFYLGKVYRGEIYFANLNLDKKLLHKLLHFTEYPFHFY